MHSQRNSVGMLKSNSIANKKRGMIMFKEDNGNVSSLRIMSFTCLIAAIVTGCYIVYKNPADASNGI